MSGTAWTVIGVIAVICVGGVILSSILQERLREQRKQNLTARFGPQIAQFIIEGKICQGMTEEMLREAFGPPADIDHQVFKTKIKQTWKYNQIGKNRFANRVYVENGVVVGWKDS